jgi:hypothetical protein
MSAEGCSLLDCCLRECWGVDAFDFFVIEACLLVCEFVSPFQLFAISPLWFYLSELSCFLRSALLADRVDGVELFTR